MITSATAQGSGREIRDSVVIRFAGDSGDGMQVTGSQFTLETALAGSDFSTFPDFPAEIRAPAGTTFGVSAFQIHFGGTDVMTPGDAVDVLVAMNPAALTVDVHDLKVGGTVIVDTSAFNERNLGKAGYAKNPLEDDSLARYQVLKFDITKLTADAVKPHGLTSREAHLCRNMWALGLLLWMYGHERAATIEWLKRKFAKKPLIAAANIAALNAGHAFGETAEMPEHLVGYVVPKAVARPGRYRTVSGTEGLAWGLVAGLRAAGIEKMVFAGYPITPASALLHTLANLRAYGVVTFQAEDEIAASGAALGASYTGALGVTSSSGPGIALKTEMLGLAIATELPLVVIDSQRAGPSTGMPTKAEQSDLFQAVHGRNADSPLAVLAAATTSDCFDVAIEAVRLATKYMTPVIVLSDGYLAHAAEPWRIPREADLPKFPVSYRTDPEGFHPFLRNPETLARPWVKPGTPQLEHRIGGLERDYDSGHISYDPDNHARMTKARADKIAGIARDIPLQDVALGDDHGALAVVGWGSTFGPIHQAVKIARDEGRDVSHVHVRYLSPFPRNLGELLKRFDRVLVPEMNNGQLVKLLRAEYLVPAEPFGKVTGKPFRVTEIVQAIRKVMEKR
ncbi:MAG: 2-oxoglutarate ferredoxin oxidoreductase subunit alpha [Gemmatimonadetes bacterium 13_2_20CM_2_65_7]|nr:MAG: 2-oxoglutarate ferredoxin oxidoreductase subunit alpha [Gemmatimonadetes bacterium 13_2_20CM_2_65_7]OLC44108.1 MAG: 2-oxoglutarate ferredoxin oxidoreductase subunit alpha [Gemmatimonadetes bacterium 13_1_40CM_4_65_7]OLD00860.1 MAG: 2-oxoglutarate ferredoxin oxidoreductase subunit alpha [Gemmatimonadetes bacterium 13_1_40CM_3_65_8]